jgi:glutamate carboxypeptidase
LRLLLVGHVDTVYPYGAAAAQPFDIRDGIAFGPGVIDMKSGVLMGMSSLRALMESGFEEYSELIYVFNNDEEVGSTGSAPLLREIARQVDIGLVLESSRSIEVVTRARTSTFRGRTKSWSLCSDRVSPQNDRYPSPELPVSWCHIQCHTYQ